MSIPTRNILFAMGGAAVGFLVAKIHFEKVYEEIAAEQIAKAKAFYSEVYRLKSGDEALPEETVEVVEKVSTFGAEEAAAALVDYQSFYATQKPSQKSEVVAPEPILEESEMGGTAVLISRDEYNDPQNEYESNTIFYWAGDNTVATPDKEKLSDEKVSKFLGDTNLEAFMDEPYEGEDVIYIRNHHYRQDFEVHYNEEAYSELA